MDKNKTKRESTPPSSLHHYTTMDTLVAILNGVTKSEEDNKFYFTFHASNAYLMNDKMEGALLLDKFFTESQCKNEYKEKFSAMKKEKGEIYAISFCKSNNRTKFTGDIPMWGMYGDKGKGAILVFDFNKLKDYLSQHDDLCICECKYINSTELAKLITAKNTEGKEANDKKEFLSNLRDEAFKLKDSHWKYEDEWRILTTSHDPKRKYNGKGTVAYEEIKIPANCLNAIILGPLVDFDMCEKVLNIAISRLKDADSTISLDIKIKTSKLQMR